jgi:drug/metabolite transporter (DMT)-like permease
MAKTAANYKIGAIYSLATIGLLSTQHPFSVLAAEKLGTSEFICVTEAVLLLCVPFLLRTAETRRDFRTLITSAAHLKKFVALLAIGVASLVLYNLGLGRSHPVVVAAILNLSPFWGAGVALLFAGKKIPTSYALFFVCFVIAFAGATMIAMSQSNDLSLSRKDLGAIFIVPVPILFALSGTLVGKWFAEYDDVACIAVTFVTAAVAIIPITLAISVTRSELALTPDAWPAISLLAVGTVLGVGLGRILYQVSLTATDNDNGFVSMFLLLEPALTCLYSLGMMRWIPQLKFTVGPLFFCGLAVVAIPIFIFSWRAWKGEKREADESAAGADPAPVTQPRLANL